MFKVTFKFGSGEDVTTFAQENENLLEAARKVNVAIDAPCGGNASCGKCKVKILEGNIDSPRPGIFPKRNTAKGGDWHV